MFDVFTNWGWTDVGQSNVLDGETYYAAGQLNRGTLELSGSSPSTPAAAFSITYTDVTVTIDGDAGVTNYVYYQKAGDVAWSTESRIGDGDITITGLDSGETYAFVVVSESGGLYSAPSSAEIATLSEEVTGSGGTTPYDIADSVKSQLNLGTFSQSFAAQRHPIPYSDIKDLADVLVFVVPKQWEINIGNRSASDRTIAVDIGIQQKLSTDIDADVDRLLTLVSEVVKYMTGRSLPDYPNARWVSVTVPAIYDADMMREHRVFMSVITVQYRLMDA